MWSITLENSPSLPSLHSMMDWAFFLYCHLPLIIAISFSLPLMLNLLSSLWKILCLTSISFLSFLIDFLHSFLSFLIPFLVVECYYPSCCLVSYKSITNLSLSHLFTLLMLLSQYCGVQIFLSLFFLLHFYPSLLGSYPSLFFPFPCSNLASLPSLAKWIH